MERGGGPGPSHTSAYGQACMQCFKAKCRCVPRAAGDSCERCFRLRKQCQRSDSTRRRTAQKSQQSDARIAQLEGKIDTLLSVMQSVASSSGSSVDLRRILNDENISLSTTDSNGPSTNSTSTIPNAREGQASITESPPTEPSHSNPFSPSQPSLPPSDLSPREAEECLDTFRSRMLPCFPFFNIAPDVTAWQLRQDRPVLFQAIITVASFSTQRKLARAEELKRLVFSSALLGVQSNMDLLIGILTYLAWSTDAFLGRADLLSRLMMLAISLVYDLRLFRPSSLDARLMLALTQGFPDNDSSTSAENIQELMDQQRAVLACFVLSSNISSHFGRIDALRWTPQMEEALRVIEINKPYPTDEAFAFQVRLQLLAQRVPHVREQQEADRARTATPSAGAPVPGLLYLKALRGQLQELRTSISPEVHQQDILNAYTQYVDLYIDQTAISISSDAPLLSMSLSGQNMDSGLLPGFARLECLWRSVGEIKAWLDIFYRMPPADCVGLPFHFWSQLIRCIVILKYLSTLQDPAWDFQAVRNTVNLLSVLDWMSKKLDIVSKEAGLQNDDDLFQLFSKLLSRSRQWAEARWNMPPQMQNGATATAGAGAVTPCSMNFDATTSVNNTSVPDLDSMAWIQSMDLENDKWFEDVLGWSPLTF